LTWETGAWRKRIHPHRAHGNRCNSRSSVTFIRLAAECIATFASHFPPAAVIVTLDRSLRCFPFDADAKLEVAMHPDLTAAAQLLLEIAGPASEHIEMSRTGPAKYYTVPRSVTLDDCLKHLRGVKTRGAQLRHPEHMARALAFDADTNKIYPGWWWMRGAAQQLADAGYRVLLGVPTFLPPGIPACILDLVVKVPE